MEPLANQPAETAWDPVQYLRFADHRLRPALELLERIPPIGPRVVCDLGCGTGAVTRLLAQRWPSAQVCGLDSSAAMLEKAKAEASTVHWMEADIDRWVPEQPLDLIYSNAALHWVGEHRKLIPRLARYLSEQGSLAIQMPLSWGAPSHRLMRETLANGGPEGRPLGDRELRDSMGRNRVEEARVYYELLADHVRTIDIWETEYLQLLEGEDAVLEWVRGTGLRPILNGLDDRERGLFLAEYKNRLRAAYPRSADGRTPYPFRRLFIVACR